LKSRRWWPGRSGFALLAAVWAAMITNFSRDGFSARRTAPYIETVLRQILPNTSPETIHIFHVYVRKLGHLLEYGLFAALLFGIFASGQSRWRLRWFGYILSIVAIMALLDEYHQSLTRMRQASLQDCLLDLSGGAVILLIIWYWQRARFR
jgi:VanZ family protein